MSRNACCYQSAFFKCHVLLALFFAPHFTVFPINLRSHSQLNLSRMRAAANAACGNASPWPPLLLQWPCDIPNPRASPSPYCSPLVFVSKLNTNWSVCLIIQLIFQGLSYLLGSIQKYRVLRRSLCGCHSCWARSLEVSACRSLSPESLLHPDFSQSNYTFI